MLASLTGVSSLTYTSSDLRHMWLPTCECIILHLRPLLQESADDGRPRRRVEPWRPEPLLCRRFNIPDPFKGRPVQARPADACQNVMLVACDRG